MFFTSARSFGEKNEFFHFTFVGGFVESGAYEEILIIIGFSQCTDAERNGCAIGGYPSEGRGSLVQGARWFAALQHAGCL